MNDIMQLCDTVRETAFAIRKIRKYALSQSNEDPPAGTLASYLGPVISLFASFAPFRG
jgi:hypothetical protein